MESKDNSTKAHAESKELLLEDYRYLADSFWKNEQTGETRVNLFIGFVTFVAGGLVSLATAEHSLKGETLSLIVIASLFSLLVLGLITMMRMLIRNKNTDSYKQGLDTIRQVFKDQLDDVHALLHYYPVEGPRRDNKEKDALKEPASSLRNSKKDARREPDGSLRKWWQEYRKAVRPRKFGGLAHTVAAINSLILAGIVGVAVYPATAQHEAVGAGQAVSIMGVYTAVAISFVLSFVVQLVYVAYREVNAKKELSESRSTHAFGVVYRLRDGVVEYLLVRPKDEDKQNEWVLPKGHIEHGEGHGEAALREVREETGIIARMICSIGRPFFSTEKEYIDGKFYLMEYQYASEAQEDRKKNWFRTDEALKELTYPESRYMLQEAEKKRAALTESQAE